MAPKETAKKGALTLEKLALYDDVLTDALVDKVGLALSAPAHTVASVRRTPQLTDVPTGLLLDYHQEEPWRPLWRVTRTE